MTRERRKWTFEEIEEHVSTWALEHLEELRDYAQDTYVDRSLIDEEKKFICDAISADVFKILQLIEPLTIDQPVLLKWAQDFIAEYKVFDSIKDD